MKFKKLDMLGFTHTVVAMLFVVIFAIGGVGYLVASHADSTTPACSSGLNPTLLAGQCESYIGQAAQPGENITVWACVTKISSTDWETTAQYLLSSSYKTTNGFNWTAAVVNTGTTPLPNNQQVNQSFVDTALPYATVNIHSNPQGENPLSFSYDAGTPVKGGTTIIGNVAQNIHPLSLVGCGSSSTPPLPAITAPSNLTATDITSNSFYRTYSASVDNAGYAITSYKTYRYLTDAGPSTAVLYSNNTDPNGFYAGTIVGLSPSTSYGFYMTATDSAGNVSAPSPTLTVTTAP